MSPPNSARTCSSLRMWLAYVVHAIAPSSVSGPPALPLSTLDLGTPQTSTPVAPGSDDMEIQGLFPSHWQQDAESGALEGSPVLDSAQGTPTTESTALFTASPRQTIPLSMHCNPPLNQRAPSPCSTDLQSDAEEDSSSRCSIGELGKRRGFKGSPLFTPELTKNPSASLLAFSAPFSPKISSPGGRPSTPCSTRTPLASITNLIRTPTTKHAKSPLSPLPSAASPAESRLSEELEECYKTLDPFSMSSESFFSPDTVHAQVSMGDIGNVRVYEHTPKIVQSPSYRSFLKSVRAVSSKEPRIKETHVYDLMVYNYQSVALVKKRRTPKTGIQVTL